MVVNITTAYAFTLNNPTYPEIDMLDKIEEYAEGVEYMIRGYESYGESSTGTPHIQGVICFKEAKSWKRAKLTLGRRAHVEPVRSLLSAAVYYCMKEGCFREGGNLRSSIDRFYDPLVHPDCDKQSWEKFCNDAFKYEWEYKVLEEKMQEQNKMDRGVGG